MLSKNVFFSKVKKISSWRKIALGTWGPASDPTIYSMLEFDAGPALDYIGHLNKNENNRVTITHIVAKAVARVYQERPDLNYILRLGRLYQRTGIDIFFQVASDKRGEDLSGTVVRDVNQKSVTELAQELNGRVKSIRDMTDTSYTKMKNLMGKVPGFFTYYLLRITGFFLYTLNLWSPLIGAPRDSFGSLMITNIGSLGLDSAFAPLVPYSRVPLILTVGTVKERPVVDNGEIKIKKILRICCTIDHRIIDGVSASYLAKDFEKYFADPLNYLS